ncbi:MAG TPA: copper chaperone PCu(A)C [Steroidobacteraceae bacterium]
MYRLITLLLSLLLLAPSVAAAQTQPLIVQNAWMRKAPGADSAAVYLVMRNASVRPVVVVGVRSPVASHVMVHETTLTAGQSRMRAYDRLVIAPGKSLTFEPGGLHVMLSGFTRSILIGQTVPLVLVLSDGSTVPVAVAVRPLDAQ